MLQWRYVTELPLMIKANSLRLPQRKRPPDWPRIRFTACVTSYAGALGAAAVLVSFLVKTDIIIREPEHMTLIPSVFLSSAGGLGGVLIAWPLARWLSEGSDRPHNLLIWWLLGVGFGIILPFLTGALLPLSAVFMELALGTIGAGELLSETLNAVFRTPIYMVTHGAYALLTSLLAGGLFGTGAWIIDRFNAASNPSVSRYGPWAVALVLGFAVVAIAAFGPPETLERLG